MEAISAIPAIPAVFSVDASRWLGTEYVPLINDIIRMVCIQVTIQLMFFLGGDTTFFTSDFFMLVIYIVLGVLLYWLGVRRLFRVD